MPHNQNSTRPLLLANARVIDPSRDLDMRGDLLIEDGVIRDAKQGLAASGGRHARLELVGLAGEDERRQRGEPVAHAAQAPLVGPGRLLGHRQRLPGVQALEHARLGGDAHPAAPAGTG